MSSGKCRSIQPLISDFLEGEIDAPARGVLFDHLKTCESCRHTVDAHLAVREQMSQLPPPPLPPRHVTRAIWEQTVEKQPTLMQRWFGATTAQLGLSAVVAFALLIIASTFFLVQGYDRRVTPHVVVVAPSHSAKQPVHEPYRIEFTKAMDKASVEQNLVILPSVESDRLTRTWDGNTLIIGANESRGTIWLPDTQYTIAIRPAARDIYGNRIGERFQNSFRTDRIDVAGGSAPSAQETLEPTSEAGGAAAGGTIDPERTTGRSGQATAEPSQIPDSGTQANSANRSEPDQTGDPTRTPLVETPQPTATRQSDPDVASDATPAAVQPTPTPAPASTATAAPTQAPSPTATSEPKATPIPVSSAFGSVYWANADVEKGLGKPVSGEVTLEASEFAFQRGAMYEHLDNGLIYIFVANAQWWSEQNTWDVSDGEGGGPGPTQDLWIPTRGFGKVWTADNDLAEAIGYALHEAPKAGEGRIQQFEHGWMLYSDQGFIYVMYDDQSWQIYSR